MYPVPWLGTSKRFKEKGPWTTEQDICARFYDIVEVGLQKDIEQPLFRVSPQANQAISSMYISPLAGVDHQCALIVTRYPRIEGSRKFQWKYQGITSLRNLPRFLKRN